MPLNPLRAWRRRRLLSGPMPEADRAALKGSLAFYSRLSASQQAKLQDLARVLLVEKDWEGCAGLVLTDRMRLVIAGQASLLLLGLPLDPRRDPIFPGLRTILVYPAGYFAPTQRVGPGGIVTEGFSNLGEAWYRGPVIVSWRDAQRDAAQGDDGRNLVLHEFAHKLDMLDGVVDGTPPLESGAQYRTWREVMTAAHGALAAAAGRGEPTLLRPYGATNPAEFFAVATEVFFERGGDLLAENPNLYQTLKMYYRQDPANWPQSQAEAPTSVG